MELPRILYSETHTPPKTPSSRSVIARKRKQPDYDELGYKPPRRVKSPTIVDVTDPRNSLRRPVSGHLHRPQAARSTPLSFTSHYGPQSHSDSHHDTGGPSAKRRRLTSAQLAAAQFLDQSPRPRLIVTSNNSPDASTSSGSGPPQQQKQRISTLVSRLRRQLDKKANQTAGTSSTIIMDWILDSMSPFGDCYSDDDLVEIAQRMQHQQEFDILRLRIKRYTFQNLDSLSEYWYDQARLWRCIQPTGARKIQSVSHPDSFERSTAGWAL